MTDRQGGLSTLANGTSDCACGARDLLPPLRGNRLVLDKWFQAQALSTREDTQEVVRPGRGTGTSRCQPQSRALADRRVQVNQRAFHHLFRDAAIASSPTTDRARQDQPGDRGGAGPAARTLEAASTRRAPRQDARRARADRRDAGAEARTCSSRRRRAWTGRSRTPAHSRSPRPRPYCRRSSSFDRRAAPPRRCDPPTCRTTNRSAAIRANGNKRIPSHPPASQRRAPAGSAATRATRAVSILST